MMANKPCMKNSSIIQNYLFTQKSLKAKINDTFYILTIILLNSFWIIILNNSSLTSRLKPWITLLFLTNLYYIYRLLKNVLSKNIILKQKYTGSSIHSITLAYIIFSLGFLAFFLSNHYHDFQKDKYITQVIDIELTDTKDATANDSIIGSTKTQTKQIKITGDKSNQTGLIQPKTRTQNFVSAKNTQTTTNPTNSKFSPNRNISPIAKLENNDIKTYHFKPKKSHQTDKKLASANLDKANFLINNPNNNTDNKESSKDDNLLKPTKPQLPVVTSWDSIKNQKFIYPIKRNTNSRNDTTMLSEVSPPELVEVLDSKPKKNTTEMAQSGGRSKNGKGASTSIQEYLKKLQKKIKKSWNPPYGQQNELEVEFEILRNGQLKSIKILKVSQNPVFDRTAIESVTKNAPYNPLPEDYEYPYLRVRYTFNYNIDGDSNIINEINQP